jgi:hypothetical protein
MHFMPDTEEEDSAAEVFWPEGYKQVLREDLRQAVGDQLLSKRPFRRIYKRHYADRYGSYEEFLGKVADMVVVGAENGADDAFDEVVDAFMEEDALPDRRAFSGYLWPRGVPGRVEERLRQVIAEEYGQDDVYSFAYSVGYNRDYPTSEEYLGRIAELVSTGAMNGANDMLEGIYRSFMVGERLAPARRHPRRLKML